MRSGFHFLFLLCLFFPHIFSTDDSPILSRPRRYLVFPEGSTFSFAFCLQMKAITPGDVDVFTQAAAAAVNYDLPNNTRALGLWDSDIRPQAAKARAERSEIYGRVEAILDGLGIEGRECVLRAICEAAQELSPGTGFLPELLRIIMTYPEGGYTEGEPKHQWKYLAAQRAGKRNLNCRDLHPLCQLSLMDLVLGLKPLPYYS